MTEPTYRLLDTGLLTAAENMALDEVILEETASGRSRPTLRFLRFSPSAVLVGRHQDVAREVREDFCRPNGIHVNRRITGGGAIFFQTSALGWELFGRAGAPPFAGSFDAVLERICQAAARAIERLGPLARFRPRNDIEVDGRKISGTGGAYADGGYMFQGTLLVRNEIELFLHSLRVPVEKLKKREIESLQQRVCFLSDLMDPLPSLDVVQDAFTAAFTDAFDLNFEKAGLTGAERRRFKERLPYFGSDEWVYGKRRRSGEAPGFLSLYQTDAGTLRVHLWLEPRGQRIRQALITGDFFCRPSRFVLDLEAALKGVRAAPGSIDAAVREFYLRTDGEFVGINRGRIVDALCSAARRRDLVAFGLSADEANELFLVNMNPEDLEAGRPAWLLLPYCSKPVECDYRTVPGCGRCGECAFDRLYELAETRGLEPYSVQSFEHLMGLLDRIGRRDGRYFVGSCCDAFYAKHQREMEASGARGVLINLDSTTCYDLGKGMEAYVGRFDNKTDLNHDLIEKVVARFHG